jgi:chromatin modification-related protein EAF6
MTENTAPASAPAPSGSADVPGTPFYERTRQHLRDLLRKKQILERNLQLTEDTIYKNETDYLEDTPAGNIITGFEGYTKGSGVLAPGGGRRRAQVVDGNRVFSRSSLSFGVGSASVSYFLSWYCSCLPYLIIVVLEIEREIHWELVKVVAN